MNRRQNFYDTLVHKKPQELILDFGGNPLSSMEGNSEAKLLEFLGFESHDDKPTLFGKTKRLDERLLEHYDIDTRSVGEIFSAKNSLFQMISDREYIDDWGIRRKYTGMYWEAVNAPLKGATLSQLEAYPFPDPTSIDIDLIEKHAARAKYLYENTDYVICAEHPVYGIFELGCWMCGFEDFLFRMAMEEDFIHCFFNRILEYQKQVIKLYYDALGNYIHYTSSGDDFATQNAPFVSPTMFSSLVKPYFKERIIQTKSYTNATYLHHSCGSVFRLMEDIIDCGVDILNPIQPKATTMDPQTLKDAFGDRIVFHGGIDTQALLPFASLTEIDETVHSTIEILNRNGGYIFAAAHNIQPDVNPQSLNCMLKAANRYRGA